MCGSAAKAPTKENALRRELLERAGMIGEQTLEAGAKAGMMEGGTAPEIAAEQLYPLLKQGSGVFAGHSFLRALREAGLAPASGDLSSQLAYPESLDAAQVKALRELLLTIARSGGGWDAEGKVRALTWSEKLYLAAALESVSAAQAKNFPGAEAGPAIEDEVRARPPVARADGEPDRSQRHVRRGAPAARAAKGRSTPRRDRLLAVFTAIKGDTLQRPPPRRLRPR